ncbi:glycosyltransferase involved in cell wall biosynthesis [Rathayibacter sp. PhB152]|uniref:glycosyltransferase family 2 protein n=1 Tax=Rathayibacter sp. PhB152 TaxID=2485190 RepID=UPI000F4CBDF3|nr:glycosyltransferase family 2 protein [Rathayibacter sp. PhB152]ROQ63873.1 glycosyltransferase involved in cell wall biosynthesis [Rathayibacter sp. PhB152]
MSRPTVTVVIPTIGRPEVERAVLSVLAQTSAVTEILVVADTLDEFQLPEDGRVKILRVGPGAGGNGARQAGVEAASGELIALLDDDDEWLPEKLERQLSLIGDERSGTWVCTSRVVMIRPGGDRQVQPRFPFEAGSDLLHYMFRKTSPLSGHGFIQASTLVFPRALALEVPFDTSLRFHQDISWLVDVYRAHSDITVIQAWAPLAAYHSTVGSVSKRIDPRASIEWARKRLAADPRTMGDFILTQSLGFARRSSSPLRMIQVLGAGVRHGRPGPSAVVYAAGAIAKTAVGR